MIAASVVKVNARIKQKSLSDDLGNAFLIVCGIQGSLLTPGASDVLRSQYSSNPAQLPPSIRTQMPVVMLLSLLQARVDSSGKTPSGC